MSSDQPRRRDTTRSQEFTVDSAPACFYLYRVFPLSKDGTPAAMRLDGPATLGRDPDGNDLAFDDPLMSRTHLEIRRGSPGQSGPSAPGGPGGPGGRSGPCAPGGPGGPWRVLDRGSKNGLFVNGVRVDGRTVGDGDVVRAGGTVLVLREISLSVPEPAGPRAPFVSFSPCMRLAEEACRRVAPTGAAVLLLGETGTGKEVLARHVHDRSGARGRFVPVNCAAIAPSLFESALFGHRRGAFTGAAADFAGLARQAASGTLFLDEIGELQPEVQPKLLRFLETGELATVGDRDPGRVDTRIVAATNADVEKAVSTGRFRRDLYARLAECVVRIPPLRDRPEDALLIALRRLRELGSGASADAAEAIAVHDWPLNVRELLAAVNAAALSSGGREVAPADLPPEVRALVHPRRDERGGTTRTGVPEPPPGPDVLAELLRTCEGNVSEVARRLGKDRKQVYRWMARHGLKGA
ncbi:MAG: sigma 54-interacting transcriptional regulator [Deltaproteobacteria bacterium]|nr:sigma 54-interacting transcriptional regulator [Deltaproteobacteria bacterium]